MPKLDFLSNVPLRMFDLLLDTLRFIRGSLRPRCAFAAEKLLLRKQLALYLEPRVKSRRAEPPAEWTLKRFREATFGGEPSRYLIHDRDRIYSRKLDSELKAMGLRILKTPSNAYCERLVGSTRRECLDFLIPLNEKHSRRTLEQRVDHCNRGRPHSSLGPGIPDPPRDLPHGASSRYRIPQDYSVVAKPILRGSHHEYGFERFAA
jgi:hypothetical protein